MTAIFDEEPLEEAACDPLVFFAGTRFADVADDCELAAVCEVASEAENMSAAIPNASSRFGLTGAGTGPCSLAREFAPARWRGSACRNIAFGKKFFTEALECFHNHT